MQRQDNYQPPSGFDIVKFEHQMKDNDEKNQLERDRNQILKTHSIAAKIAAAAAIIAAVAAIVSTWATLSNKATIELFINNTNIVKNK